MTLTIEAHLRETECEARRLERMDVCRSVSLFEPFMGETYAAVTSNVSNDGVCLIVAGDVSLRPGRFVTLHDLPTMGPRLSDASPRATTARVVWVARDDEQRVCVGLQLYNRPIAAAA